MNQWETHPDADSPPPPAPCVEPCAVLGVSCSLLLGFVLGVVVVWGSAFVVAVRREWRR